MLNGAEISLLFSAFRALDRKVLTLACKGEGGNQSPVLGIWGFIQRVFPFFPIHLYGCLRNPIYPLLVYILLKIEPIGDPFNIIFQGESYSLQKCVPESQSFHMLPLNLGHSEWFRWLNFGAVPDELYKTVNRHEKRALVLEWYC